MKFNGSREHAYSVGGGGGGGGRSRRVNTRVNRRSRLVRAQKRILTSISLALVS